MAGIDYVLNDEHVLALNIATNVHHKPHSATCDTSVTVAGNSDEFDCAWNAEASRQVCEKYEGALQYANHDEFVAVVVIG